jgi:hypothetical protein
MGPSVNGEGVSASILSVAKSEKTSNLLTNIRINAVDVWWHHELHVEAFVAISQAIVGLHLILVLHGHVVSIARLGVIEPL